MPAAKKQPLAVDRQAFTVPPPDSPDLAHITPELRPLAFPVERLIKLPDNYRQGDTGAVATSIERYTQRIPIVVNVRTGHVEAGNTRLDAILSLRKLWIAAVLVDDDPTTERGFALVDNRAHDLGLNIDSLLAKMIIEVRDEDPGLYTGFDDDDLNRLVASLDLDLPDEANVHFLDGEPDQLPAGRNDEEDGEFRPRTDEDPSETITLSVPRGIRQELLQMLRDLKFAHDTTTMGEALYLHLSATGTH